MNSSLRPSSFRNFLPKCLRTRRAYSPSGIDSSTKVLHFSSSLSICSFRKRGLPEEYRFQKFDGQRFHGEADIRREPFKNDKNQYGGRNFSTVTVTYTNDSFIPTQDIPSGTKVDTIMLQETTSAAELLDLLFFKGRDKYRNIKVHDFEIFLNACKTPADSDVLYSGLDFFLYKNKVPTHGTLSKLISAAINTNSVVRLTGVLLNEKSRFGMLLTPRYYIYLIHSLGKINKEPKLMIELFNKYWTDFNLNNKKDLSNVNVNAHSRVIYTMTTNLIHLDLDSVIDDLLQKVDQRFINDKTKNAIDTYRANKNNETDENETADDSTPNPKTDEKIESTEAKAT